ncbi:N-acetyltransferase family protein [Virgibacillus sp. FSP13]
MLAMYVSPDARGLGIGKALLTEAINKAKELGKEQLQLTVVSNNEAAKTLYTQCGFTVYGVEKEAKIYFQSKMIRSTRLIQQYS